MMGECSREAHLCLARSRGLRRGLLCRRAGCGKAGVGVGGFPMQWTAAHDTAFSERHDRARSATTLDSSPAARPSQHVTTSHVVPAHQVRLDCVFPEQHRHRVVDMSGRNLTVGLPTERRPGCRTGRRWSRRLHPAMQAARAKISRARSTPRCPCTAKSFERLAPKFGIPAHRREDGGRCATSSRATGSNPPRFRLGMVQKAATPERRDDRRLSLLVSDQRIQRPQPHLVSLACHTAPVDRFSSDRLPAQAVVEELHKEGGGGHLTWIGSQCVSLLVGRRLPRTPMPRSHRRAPRRAALVIRTKVRAASPDGRAVIRRREFHLEFHLHAPTRVGSRLMPVSRAP